MTVFFETELGRVFLADALHLAAPPFQINQSILIMTSPPFGLVRKKHYGNVDADKYLEWLTFASHFKRILKTDGSFVIDIGGSWIPGQPIRSLYHYELLIMLCKEFGFHLAQEFFWWNPRNCLRPLNGLI